MRKKDPMRHRKSIPAEQMRRAAIKACQEVGDQECAKAILGLPVVFDTVPHMAPEECAVVEAAVTWAEADMADGATSKALMDAVMALRNIREKASR